MSTCAWPPRLTRSAGDHPLAAKYDPGRGHPFADPRLLSWLEATSPQDLDALPYGVVAMASDTTVEHYNLAESRLSGLTPARVIGRPFFAAVAPCVNNGLVAGRYETEPEIDAMVEAVFTFRLRPVNVRLRLLKQPGARRIYLLVDNATRR